jgi:hypothetical protein
VSDRSQLAATVLRTSAAVARAERACFRASPHDPGLVVRRTQKLAAARVAYRAAWQALQEHDAQEAA